MERKCKYLNKLDTLQCGMVATNIFTECGKTAAVSNNRSRMQIGVHVSLCVSTLVDTRSARRATFDSYTKQLSPFDGIASLHCSSICLPSSAIVYAQATQTRTHLHHTCSNLICPPFLFLFVLFF